MKLYDVIRKEQIDHGVNVDPTPPPPLHPMERHHKFSWKKILVIASALILLALLYILGMKVVTAKVYVTERKIPFSLENAQVELTHERTAGTNRLSFQAMSVTTEITREVYGSVARASTSKAKGNAVFFNEFSTSTQTIKSGTTLIGANGKRYITQAAATVPGYTMQSKVKKAGTSTNVPIVAADMGSSFNTDGTTFTISGFSGTKAKQLYARSAGAITGGEVGALHTVSESDREDVMETLKVQLTERLRRATRAQIPDTLITYPDLQFVSIDMEEVNLEGSSIKFPVRMKGTMVSYLIPRDLFEASIVKKAISTQEYTHVTIPTLADLLVEPVTAIPTNTTTIPDSITVSISGSGTIITKVPLEEVKELLIGVPRTKFSDTLTTVPEIDSARFSLMPFWAPFFPKDTKDIIVIPK